MTVSLRHTGFDPWNEIRRFQDETLHQPGSFGATTSFVGTMRDFNEGDAVRAMELEYYPGMTEQYLRRIRAEALHNWDILDALIIHRVGHIHPSDPIVLVAVWSAHRAAAFEACSYLIEKLKANAPFWK